MDLLSWLTGSETPHSRKDCGRVHTPASVPIADPSRAWQASRGEYSRTAPRMRREGPRASQAKTCPTPRMMPCVTWNEKEESHVRSSDDSDARLRRPKQTRLTVSRKSTPVKCFHGNATGAPLPALIFTSVNVSWLPYKPLWSLRVCVCVCVQPRVKDEHVKYK